MSRPVTLPLPNVDSRKRKRSLPFGPNSCGRAGKDGGKRNFMSGLRISPWTATVVLPVRTPRCRCESVPFVAHRVGTRWSDPRVVRSFCGRTGVFTSFAGWTAQVEMGKSVCKDLCVLLPQLDDWYNWCTYYLSRGILCECQTLTPENF